MPAERLGILDALMFGAEVAVYAAVGVIGWRINPLTGIAGIVVMAAWWGCLHSPKTPVRLPGRIDLALRGAWFVVGLMCALRVVGVSLSVV